MGQARAPVHAAPLAGSTPAPMIENRPMQDGSSSSSEPAKPSQDGISAELRARIRLRPLAEADIPAVARFEREIAHISFPEDPVDDLGFYERKLATALKERKSLLLLLDLDGAPIGWAWLAPRTNFVTKETYGDLRSFYIDKSYRGGFCALRLMRACLDYCREHRLKRIVGRTSVANENMQALYRLFDFEPRHVTFERVLDKAKREEQG